MRSVGRGDQPPSPGRSGRAVRSAIARHRSNSGRARRRERARPVRGPPPGPGPRSRDRPGSPRRRPAGDRDLLDERRRSRRPPRAAPMASRRRPRRGRAHASAAAAGPSLARSSTGKGSLSRSAPSGARRLDRGEHEAAVCAGEGFGGLARPAIGDRLDDEGKPSVVAGRDGRADERVLGRRRGLVVGPVRAAGACTRRRRGGARRRGAKSSRSVVDPPVADGLVALRLERHDQADDGGTRPASRAAPPNSSSSMTAVAAGASARDEPELEGSQICVAGQLAEAASASSTRRLSRWSIASQPRDRSPPRSGQPARRASGAACGGRRHGRTSGRRGSGAIDGHSVRTQARSGSSVLAIVRRSPASAFR